MADDKDKVVARATFWSSAIRDSDIRRARRGIDSDRGRSVKHYRNSSNKLFDNHQCLKAFDPHQTGKTFQKIK
jgi:hypothetical protein